EKTSQLAHHVVGVEHRVLSGLTQAFEAIGLDVSQGAYGHAEVAVKSAHPADAPGPVVIQLERPLRPLRDDGQGQVRLEDFLHRYRSRARAAAAVRCAESLVQI